MVYLVTAANVGVTILFNFIVAVLDKMELSVSSIFLKRLECLNTLSNFCRLFVLNELTAVSTKALISVLVFSVKVELYFAVIPITKYKTSGSTITGTIEATL